MNDDWEQKFRDTWERGVCMERRAKVALTMFEAQPVAFLSSIGCTAQELFDFVDDSISYHDLDFDSVLEITAIRREFFLNVMDGERTGRVVPMDELPAKSARVDGIAWLPRLIAKARIKLRGEMDPDLMYGCAGDRLFLRQRNLALPQFLQLVLEHGDDDRAIIEAKKSAVAR